MSEIDTITPSDTPTPASETPAPVPDNAEAAAAPAADASAKEFPWSREHPEWGPEDVHKAYTELRTRFSAGEHKQPAAEPDPEPVDPWATLPPDDDPQTVQRLVNLFRQPGGARSTLDWIDQNPGYVSEQTKAEFYRAWLDQDPLNAQQYIVERQFAQHQQTLAQQFQQQMQPAIQHVQQQINGTAIEIARQQIPDFEAWSEPLAEYVTRNAASFQQFQSSPQQMADALTDAYYVLHGRAMREQQATQPVTPREPTPPRTATTSSASRPRTNEDEHREAVLKSLRETKIPGIH